MYVFDSFTQKCEILNEIKTRQLENCWTKTIQNYEVTLYEKSCRIILSAWQYVRIYKVYVNVKTLKIYQSYNNNKIDNLHNRKITLGHALRF